MKKYFVIAILFFSFFIFTHAASADTFTYLDTNNDAQVDTIRWSTGGEMFTGCVFDSADWTVNNPGTIGISSITGLSCSGGDNNLNISVAAENGKTGGFINPVISYSANNFANIPGEGGYMPGFQNQSVLDDSSPKILSVSPTSGSASQSISTPIVINFSEPINPTMFSFSISPSLTYTPSWSDANQKVTLSHSESYANSTQINASISNAYSITGSPAKNIDSQYNWSFTTVAAPSSGGSGSSRGGSSGGGGSSSSLIVSNMSISINNSVPTTQNTKVSLKINAANATQMMISNEPSFLNSTWIPYVNNLDWTLPDGEGKKNIYIKFKSSTGSTSSTIMSSVTLIKSTIFDPTPDMSYTFNTPLNNKSPLQTIKNLQTVLNSDVGNMIPKKLIVDGKWGKATTIAVQYFQIKHNLSPDGKAGPKTRAELNKVIVK